MNLTSSCTTMMGSPPPPNDVCCTEPPEKKRKQPQSSDPSTIFVERKLSPVATQPIEIPLGGGDDASLLQQLLGPVELSIFQTEYFQQCAVHIRAGEDDSTKTRYAALTAEHLFDLDALSLLQETASENLFVWLQDPTTRRIHSIEVNDAATAHRLHVTGGHSTYCRAPPATEHVLVQSLLHDTGLCPTGHASSLARGEVELFLSSQVGAVTDWHFDFQENFTLQLSGIKQWRLRRSNANNSSSRIRHPLRACTPHYQSPSTVESQLLAARLADPNFVFAPPQPATDDDDDEDEIIIVTLRPGDCFYFPAGLWHRVEVVETGVSLNISLMATHTVASLTCQALQHWLVAQPDARWRQCVLPTMQQQQLQHLVEGQLPQLVQRFVDSYGVAATLPPAMRTKAEWAIEEGEDMMEQDEAEEDNDEEPEEVMDVSKFVAPFDGFSRMQSLAQGLEQCRLVINPLACILKQEEEVDRYYQTTNNAIDGTEVLFLNVSYAGNECHESLLRVCLRATVGAFDEVKQLLLGDVATKEEQQRILSRHARLVDCLVHFGYLLRKPRAT